MKSYDAILREFAEETTLAAKRALGSKRIGKNRSYGVASRNLQKSLEFSISGGTIRFGSPLPYAAFVHWGVNGTKKRHGSPYSYGSKQPPLDPILEWMRVKPVRLRDENGAFISPRPYRSKRTGKKVDPMRNAAFGIARAIKRNGMPGVKYWTEGLETMVPRYQEQLAEAQAREFLKEVVIDTDNIKVKLKQ